MSPPDGAVGVYPGTFNPFTRAHLAIAEAALATGLARLDLVVSLVGATKGAVDRPLLQHRLEVL